MALLQGDHARLGKPAVVLAYAHAEGGAQLGRAMAMSGEDGLLDAVLMGRYRLVRGPSGALVGAIAGATPADRPPHEVVDDTQPEHE